MDEKHRQYCIKLGNPYMNDDRYQKQYNKETPWKQTFKMQDDDWMKNSKKFTN